jgi:hypothetical protein
MAPRPQIHNSGNRVVIRVLLGGAPVRLGKATAASPMSLEELQQLSHDATRYKEGERAKNTGGVR